MSAFLTLIKSALDIAPLFILGSAGETLTEKSGHLNLGVPGVMCLGTTGGMFGLHIYDLMIGGNPDAFNGVVAFIICFLFTIIIGALSGLLFSFFTVTLRCNQNVMGLTFTTFGVGGYKLVHEVLKDGNSFYSGYCSKFATLFPNLESTNLLNHGVLFFLSFVIALVIAIVLKKTRVGLSLRAVGENAASSDAAGINVSKYRYIATMIGCAIAALGGFYYFLEMKRGIMEFTEVDAFGWLAVALVIFTLWKTDLGILGALLFGFLYKLPTVYPIGSSSDAINILFKYLPYFVTIVILILLSIFDKKGSQAPGDLGLSYFREER